MVNNAKEATLSTYENILCVGDPGSGKSSLIRTLPGKKFVYIFDPNGLRSLAGADVDYEEWLPDSLELDTTIKRFNRDGKPDDRPATAREPRVYIDWCSSIAEKAENMFFKDYIWQDEISKKITTQLALSGSAKKQIPLVMSNIWLTECKSTEKEIKYTVQTRPADRGLQTIRTSIRGLEMFEDVTIRDFEKPEQSGVGKLLTK
jgi:GTPase SAR1 family protein